MEEQYGVHGGHYTINVAEFRNGCIATQFCKPSQYRLDFAIIRGMENVSDFMNIGFAVRQENR